MGLQNVLGRIPPNGPANHGSVSNVHRRLPFCQEPLQGCGVLFRLNPLTSGLVAVQYYTAHLNHVTEPHSQTCHPGFGCCSLEQGIPDISTNLGCSKWVRLPILIRQQWTITTIWHKDSELLLNNPANIALVDGCRTIDFVLKGPSVRYHVSGMQGKSHQLRLASLWEWPKSAPFFRMVAKGAGSKSF